MQDISLTARRRAIELPPLKVGTRRSPLAIHQTRLFLDLVRQTCPLLRDARAFEEHALSTSGDRIQDRRLADIGGKGLFAKELHEALLDGHVDLAVHSLKDLETELPAGITLACVLKREDPRDALILGPVCDVPDKANPLSCIPGGALIGTASVRRQSQILHARPDLRCAIIRGNVQTRLGRVRDGDFAASFLALAGLRRLGLGHEADVVLDPDLMVPAAGQGIIGVTARAADIELQELLSMIDDHEARIASAAERAVLSALDGSCRTPIGAHARALPDGRLSLTGLLARPDGTYLMRHTVQGLATDAAKLGVQLGNQMRQEAPADLLA
jgi:hydroxymethylbilane synthase